jgi:hypothetical protein
MIWVIRRNQDETESSLTLRENRSDAVMYDTDGKKMKLVCTFEAGTYDEAKKFYENFLFE